MIILIKEINSENVSLLAIYLNSGDLTVTYKDPEEVACKGCRLEENGCKFLGQPCETLKCVEEKNLAFCFECKEFPCVKLQPAKEGADRYPHNFKLFNLCRMKTVGVEKWAEEEAKLIRQRCYSGKFIPGSGPILQRYNESDVKRFDMKKEV